MFFKSQLCTLHGLLVGCTNIFHPKHMSAPWVLNLLPFEFDKLAILLNNLTFHSAFVSANKFEL